MCVCKRDAAYLTTVAVVARESAVHHFVCTCMYALVYVCMYEGAKGEHLRRSCVYVCMPLCIRMKAPKVSTCADAMRELFVQNLFIDMHTYMCEYISVNIYVCMYTTRYVCTSESTV
jgi:hypothetical protein